MVFQEVYNVQHGLIWGLLITAFPFFTGLSAGSFTLSTLAYVFGKKEYKVISKNAVLMAIVLLLMANMTLFADTTQPTRAYYTFLYPNIASMFSWATFVISAYLLCSIIYAYFIFTGNDKYAKVMGIICIPVALGVHADTGFVFGLNKGMVLWHTALMPVLFLVSALTSGIALLIVVVTIKEKFFPEKKKIDPEIVYSIGNLLVFFLVLEFFLDIVDITTMLYSAAEEYEAIMLWLNGPLSFSFLWIQIFLGGVLPLLLLSHPKTGRTYLGQGLAGALVVIGTFAMRFNVIVGGQMIPKSEAGLVPYTNEIGYIGYSLLEEILLLVGIIAFGTVAYILALKYTPRIITMIDGIIGKSAAMRGTEVPLDLEE